MKPIAWSHSSLSDFRNCPKAFYRKRIAKDVLDPPNDAGLAGDYMHKVFEMYLKSGGTAILPSTYPTNIRDWPQGLKTPDRYKDYLDKILLGPGMLLVENKYAINRDMQPCMFLATDVWCRSILDVLRIDGEMAWSLDHKTGKRKEDTRQLKLSALQIFAHHPEVMRVSTRYCWLVAGVVDKSMYTRDQVVELWAEFIPDLRQYVQAFKTETFVPRPSGLCNGWCPVTDCEFWKPKRSR